MVADRKAKSILRNNEEFSVTPITKGLPPLANEEKNHRFRDKRLSNTMIQPKSLDYTIPSRIVKRTSGMGNYDKN